MSGGGRPGEVVVSLPAERDLSWLDGLTTLTPCASAWADRRDWWFPEGGKEEGWYAYSSAEAEAAKFGCQMCPVSRACLLDALKLEWSQPRNSRHGIYGGTSPVDRFRMEERLTAAGLGPDDLSDGIELIASAS